MDRWLRWGIGREYHPDNSERIFFSLSTWDRVFLSLKRPFLGATSIEHLICMQRGINNKRRNSGKLFGCAHDDIIHSIRMRIYGAWTPQTHPSVLIQLARGIKLEALSPPAAPRTASSLWWSHSRKKDAAERRGQSTHRIDLCPPPSAQPSGSSLLSPVLLLLVFSPSCGFVLKRWDLDGIIMRYSEELSERFVFSIPFRFCLGL